MFSTNFALLQSLLDPGLVLFGILLFLFGALFLCLFLLEQAPNLIRLFFVLIFLIEITLLGHVVLNLFLPHLHVVSESFSFLQILFLSHRWYLLVLSFFLILQSLLIVGTYKEQLIKHHAKAYLLITRFSLVCAFVFLLISVFES